MKQPSEPIPNWALYLVRNQPVTECVAPDGTVLGSGRSQPIKAVREGLWTQIRQGPLSVSVHPQRRVFKGDVLTFTMPDGFPDNADAATGRGRHRD